MQDEGPWMRAALVLTSVTLAMAVLFAMLPGIDLWVSGLFWQEGRGFWRADGAIYRGLRDGIRWSGNLAAVLCLVMAAVQAGMGPRQRTGWRVWAYVGATVLIGPGLLVNGVLKPLVARARPADVVAFGGTRQFTPPFQITDQCAASCSFTSGEAALVAGLAIPLVVVLWRGFGPAGRAQMLGLAGLYVATGAGLRVVMGRHFLSDVVFGVLITAFVALILYPLLGIATARRRFHLAGVWPDLRAIWQALAARGRGRN